MIFHSVLLVFGEPKFAYSTKLVMQKTFETGDVFNDLMKWGTKSVHISFLKKNKVNWCELPKATAMLCYMFMMASKKMRNKTKRKWKKNNAIVPHYPITENNCKNRCKTFSEFSADQNSITAQRVLFCFVNLRAGESFRLSISFWYNSRCRRLLSILGPPFRCVVRVRNRI